MYVFVVYSFHVGSGAQSSTAYANALALAKDVFITAVSITVMTQSGRLQEKECDTAQCPYMALLSLV